MIDVDVVYRPLQEHELAAFPRTLPVVSAFDSTWTATLALLRREVAALNDRGPVLCVVQLDIAESAIRKDGQMVAGREARSGKVAVSFPSRYGPLRYQTAMFVCRWSKQGPSWHQNVRAIALALEALRKVDRYGVSARGEQYTGWAQLGAGRPMGSAPEPMSEDEALAVLSAGSDMVLSRASSAEDIRLAFKRAAVLVHPDKPNGSEDAFKRLVQARDLLLPQGGTQ